VTDRPAVVRIVHPGGPACMAQVWIGDQQLHNVIRVEFEPLDVNDNSPVKVRLTLVDVEFAIEAELLAADETQPA
jgi:hypothetical protein